MAKLIHSMVRALNEAKSTQFYSEAFNLKTIDRLDFDDFTLVYLGNAESDFELELTVNKQQTVPYDLGDGYGHIAVCVDDVEAKHKQLLELNLAPRKIVNFDFQGRLFARFFFIADPDGYQIEVLQKFGRYK